MARMKLKLREKLSSKHQGASSTTCTGSSDSCFTGRRFGWKFLLAAVVISSTFVSMINRPLKIPVIRYTPNGVKRQKKKKKKATKQKNCAQNDGVVIANLHGRLANNLFQVALAHRLSEDICWPIIFKEGWQGVFLYDLPNAHECFPNALQGNTRSPETATIGPRELEWFRYMRISELTNSHWPDNNLQHFYEMLPHRDNGGMYDKWLQVTRDEGTSLSLNSKWEFDYNAPGGWAEYLVDALRHPGNKTFIKNKLQEVKTIQPYSGVRTVHLNAFYVHYGWMEPHMDLIRRVLQMNVGKCCHHIPPDNAIVIHIRNFQYFEQLDLGFKNSVYVELLDRIFFSQQQQNDKVLWIVCQPDDVGIALVKELEERYNGTIITGKDPIDAFCTISQARKVVLSPCSTFSQMAALLSPHFKKGQEVHYLLEQRNEPKVTLVVPDWRYHLVDDKSKASILEWDVNTSTIRPDMS